MELAFLISVFIFTSLLGVDKNIKSLVLQEKIAEALDTLPKDPTGEEVFWAALTFDQAGFFEKALAHYTRYIEENDQSLYRSEAKNRKEEIEKLFSGELTSLPDLKETRPNASNSLPINQYVALLQENSKSNISSLPPYLQARLYIELSDDYKKAYEIFPSVWTLEGLLIKNPDLAYEEMEKNPKLKTPYLLSLYYLEKGNPKAALPLLSQDTPKLLFTKIRALKMLGREEEAHKLTKLYLQNPSSTLQAEMAFSLFSYQDYLFGEKEAVKHLHQFVKNYPTHPLILNAYYLMGLDLKKERRKLHPKSLNEASDVLLEVVNRFNQVKIPKESYTYYLSLKHEAILERAKTLKMIAEEGGESKRKIYLEYAMEVVDNLQKEPLTQEEKGNALLLKSSLLILNGEDPTTLVEAALPSLNATHQAQAKLELAKLHPNSALKYLDQVDKLPIDAQLSAKIIKSDAYERIGDLDLALSTLSEVINESAVSEKRIEAMYKRAVIYEKQNRQDLALRQLEACKNKGGEWGSKAALRLKEIHEQL